MPFGKKKDKSNSMKEKSGYPTQAAPTAYPQAPPQQGPPPQQMYASAPPPYGQEPPPPYSPAQAAAAAPPQGYYPPPQQGYYPPPPAQGYPVAQAPGMAPPPRPGGTNTTVVMQGGFDAGARFDGISQPNIPPPPPGCMPNAAQMAMNRGHNVVVSQRPGNFWEGGSDGGYTIF